ncbi:hypothetical protein F5051DRAFT_425850 [Lentinula edodes]|nr:hypothetical protein F5051DRAFT_425850 [Lentinula edodes]
MHRDWWYDIMLNLFIILGCVSVALTAALPPVPEHTFSLKPHPKVDVTLHGKAPADEAATRAAKIEIQALLYQVSGKIDGSPDLTIHTIHWNGKPQGSTETPDRITFDASVSGLRPEDSGVYTGFYFYSGAVPKEVKPGNLQSKKKRPAKINDRIERILNAKVTSPQGDVLLNLEVPEDRILQTTPTLSDDEDLEPGV